MAHFQQPTYEDQPARTRIVLLIVLPAILGVVSGIALGFNGPAYWVCQVIAMLGGFSAGTECRGIRTILGRGLLSGMLFGATIIITRMLLDRPDHANLGGSPGLLPVVTGLVGLTLGVLGWVAFGRKRAAAVEPAARLV